MRKNAKNAEETSTPSTEFSETILPTTEQVQAEFAGSVESEAVPDVETSEASTEKPRRKRRKKSGPIVEVVPEVRPEAFEGLIAFALNAWFRRDKKPELSPEESKALAQAVTAVLNKHAGALAAWNEEIALISIAAIVYGNRYFFGTKETSVRESTQEERIGAA